jgi:inorganic pyrophosphatase
MKFFLLSVLVLLLYSCTNYDEVEGGLNISESNTVLIDHSKTSLRDDKGYIKAVIEIPAGTNHKYEYNYELKDYECEIRQGKPRVVNYLPYPGNYGFIPGTLMDKQRGGDGDALDVLVLGETVNQGSIIAIKPIATLKLLDGGEEDHKVIAVPVNKELNVLGVNSFAELPESVKTILMTWFSSYKGIGKMEFLHWEGDSATLEEVTKWVKNAPKN